jgi:hypothetical protein
MLQKSQQPLIGRALLFAVLFLALMFGLGSVSAQKKDESSPKNDDPIICNVADLKLLALSINSEQEREKSVSEWLTKFGKICSTDQLIYIRGNFPGWLGTANSPSLNRKVEAIVGGKSSSQKNYEIDIGGLDKSPGNNLPGNYSSEKISNRR